jgi:hypothetical protein
VVKVALTCFARGAAAIAPDGTSRIIIGVGSLSVYNGRRVRGPQALDNSQSEKVVPIRETVA